MTRRTARRPMAVAHADGSISILVDALDFAFKTSDPRVAASVWDSVAVKMMPPSLAGCDWGDYGGLLAMCRWDQRMAFETAYASCLQEVRNGSAKTVAARETVTVCKDAPAGNATAQDFVRRCMSDGKTCIA